MSATALRLAVLGLAAAVTVIVFTGPASPAAGVASASRIVFHSRLKGGNNEIFAVNANGTGLSRGSPAALRATPTRPGRRTAGAPPSSRTGTATGAATRTRTCS